jgi:hypothetical protein
MDEIELVKAVGDVWDDAGEIIESMHELRKRIEALYTKAADEALADIYKLANAQVDLVQTSLRVTLTRIENSVRATQNAMLAPEKHAAEEPDKGQADVGQADVGQLDMGQADMGQADMGQADMGQPDKAQPDKGNGTQATVMPDVHAEVDHDREVDAAAS